LLIFVGWAGKLRLALFRQWLASSASIVVEMPCCMA
jgi:hypothetical protein